MTRIVSYLTLLCLIVSCCGERISMARILSAFTKHEIVIPDDLECINNKTLSLIDKSTLKPLKLVIFHDSINCTTCHIAHIAEYYPLYMMSDTYSFSVLTILSPEQSDVEEIKKELITRGFCFPIYIDTYGSFKNLNEHIPTDQRFHCFLLNQDNYPILVGNPLANTNLHELFIDILLTNNNLT